MVTMLVESRLHWTIHTLPSQPTLVCTTSKVSQINNTLWTRTTRRTTSGSPFHRKSHEAVKFHAHQNPLQMTLSLHHGGLRRLPSLHVDQISSLCTLDYDLKRRNTKHFVQCCGGEENQSCYKSTFISGLDVNKCTWSFSCSLL